MLVVDIYFSLAPEAVLLIIGSKNVVGFGFSYGVIPWVTALEYSRTFGTVAGIQLLLRYWDCPFGFLGRD